MVCFIVETAPSPRLESAEISCIERRIRTWIMPLGEQPGGRLVGIRAEAVAAGEEKMKNHCVLLRGFLCIDLYIYLGIFPQMEHE